MRKPDLAPLYALASSVFRRRVCVWCLRIVIGI
jgi:hypothetical protein